MKTQIKLFVSIYLGIFMVIGCHAQSQKVVLNSKIAESFISTLNRQNYDQFTDLFSENATYEEVCSGRFYTGKTEIKNYIVGTINGIPDTKFELISVTADEKHAAVEWIWVGTNSVGWPQMNIPATNKSIKLKGISIMKIENGKITANRDYWDWNSFMKELGLQ